MFRKQKSTKQQFNMTQLCGTDARWLWWYWLKETNKSVSFLKSSFHMSVFFFTRSSSPFPPLTAEKIFLQKKNEKKKKVR